MVSGAQGRVDWVDAAKGICIIFVVMMHSTIGVGEAMGGEGWMHYVVSFARPFRMPDFFLISGLFLGLVIDRSWRGYADRKVVHFLYFYVLWLSIQFVFRAPGMAMESGIAEPFQQYLLSFVQPFGTLWFIYILPIFFLFTRAVKTLPVWLVLGWAALLEMLPVHTGWGVFDEFCARYIYFFAGYAFATRVFDIAAWIRANRGKALALLAGWAVVNGTLVFSPVPDALIVLTDRDVRLATLPLVSLALGVGGAMAIVAVATLVTRFRDSAWLTWLGAHSIVVYLAFFLPMSTSRIILVKTGIITDVGLLSALVTIAGVTAPVVLFGLIQWTGRGRFLFERPSWARIESAQPKPRRAFEAAK